jgi:hypothetical protein
MLPDPVSCWLSPCSGKNRFEDGDIVQAVVKRLTLTGGLAEEGFFLDVPPLFVQSPQNKLVLTDRLVNDNDNS